MRHLDLTVFEPGDMLATMSQDGKVAVFTVTLSGQLQPSDNRLFASGLSMEDPIESLDLTVRTYNCLKREQINTIGEMAAFYDKGEEAMFEVRNFGQKSVDEVGAVLKRLRGTNESHKETPLAPTNPSPPAGRKLAGHPTPAPAAQPAPAQFLRKRQ
jgi:hypothetical protein